MHTHTSTVQHSATSPLHIHTRHAQQTRNGSLRSQLLAEYDIISGRMNWPAMMSLVDQSIGQWWCHQQDNLLASDNVISGWIHWSMMMSSAGLSIGQRWSHQCVELKWAKLCRPYAPWWPVRQQREPEWDQGMGTCYQLEIVPHTTVLSLYHHSEPRRLYDVHALLAQHYYSPVPAACIWRNSAPKSQPSCFYTRDAFWKIDLFKMGRGV